MTAQELETSATSGNPMPTNLSPALQALWLEKSGDWHAAHDLCDSIPEPNGSWIHAYLHRVEGDLNNAAYWYNRAKKPIPTTNLTTEWHEIATTLA